MSRIEPGQGNQKSMRADVPALPVELARLKLFKLAKEAWYYNTGHELLPIYMDPPAEHWLPHRQPNWLPHRKNTEHRWCSVMDGTHGNGKNTDVFYDVLMGCHIDTGHELHVLLMACVSMGAHLLYVFGVW